jgi:hypothetical protein
VALLQILRPSRNTFFFTRKSKVGHRLEPIPEGPTHARNKRSILATTVAPSVIKSRRHSNALVILHQARPCSCRSRIRTDRRGQLTLGYPFECCTQCLDTDSEARYERSRGLGFSFTSRITRNDQRTRTWTFR